MIEFLKKLFIQYITCKHEKYTVLRKITCFDNFTPKYFERRICKICGREYYSDYFYEIGKKRIYLQK